MESKKTSPWLDTHEALKGLWGLYWDARCPDLLWGVPSLPRDNALSLKIKADIERVTLALSESNRENMALKAKK